MTDWTTDYSNYSQSLVLSTVQTIPSESKHKHKGELQLNRLSPPLNKRHFPCIRLPHSWVPRQVIRMVVIMMMMMVMLMMITMMIIIIFNRFYPAWEVAPYPLPQYLALLRQVPSICLSLLVADILTWWHGDMLTWWHDDMLTYWHADM